MQKPPLGILIPWRLHLQNLQVAFCHGHLRKVEVGLIVYWKTGLFWDKNKDRQLWGNVQIFYLAGTATDLSIELVITSLKESPRAFTCDK